MIIGINNLNKEQKELMFRVNELHTKCVGHDYKEGMKITKAWIDENSIVCVLLKNGEWYHYTKNQEWY